MSSEDTKTSAGHSWSGRLVKMGLVLVAPAVLVLCLFLLGGCAGTPKAMSSEEAWSKFVGDWVNLDYSGMPPYSQRLVFGADLSMTEYIRATDTTRSAAMEIKPRNSWFDRAGNVCCEVYFSYKERYTSAGLALFRVDSLGKVFEADWLVGAPEQGAMADFAAKYLEQIQTELPATARTKPAGGLSTIYCIYYRK